MSKLQRLRDTVRGIWSGPITSNSPEIARLWSTQPVSSGVTVTEATAMQYSAFHSAVNLISSDVATLPLVFYKRDAEGGREVFRSHPLYRLLHDQPNVETTSVNFRKVLQAHALVWGNGYAEIERDGAGRPKNLWQLTPDRVTPFRRTPNSLLEYLVADNNGHQVSIPAADMLHIHGLGWDGTRGYGTIHYMAESIGLGLASERFGGSFYGNGATVGGVITYPTDPSDLVKKNNRDTLAARHEGVKNANKLLALYGGAQYQSIGIPPNQAQFLETRQFQITEIARWFNVPPHKIGDLSRSTNNNIEQQSLDYYSMTLRPWLTAWEQELLSKLVPASEVNIQFFEHKTEDLLRADVLARSEAYSHQFNVGAIIPNEIRQSENRNKVKGGDRAFVMRNMIPLDRIDEIIDAEIAKAKPVTPPVVPTPTVDTSAREDALAAELALARRKAQEAEDAKDIANNSLTEVRAELQREHESHLDTLRSTEATIAQVTGQATSLGKELEAARRDLEAAKDYTSVVEQERDAIAAISAETTTARGQAVTRAEQAEAEREHFRKQTEGLSFDIVAAQEETARANTRAEAADQRTQVSEAVVTELRAQVGSLTTDADTRRAELADSITQAAGLEVSRYTEHVRRTHAETALAISIQRKREVTDALRSALAYSVSSIIRRESDRARKAQASPDKLLRHVEHFYGSHGEFCREALRPILRAVAALDGRDANEMLDQLVPVMVEESTVQLRLVADDADTESLAPALERVLRRWEAERGDAIADRLMKEVA